MTTPYSDLLDRARDAHRIRSIAALLAWDQEAMMPPGGVEWRSRQLAQLARIGHELATDPRVGELLQECETTADLVADPYSDSAANLRELRRTYDREVELPATLVAEIAATQSLAQHAWAEARRASEFARFRPWLEKVLGLMQRKAECIGCKPDQEPWDVLAEGFEPGVRAASLRELFPPLRDRLTGFVGELLDNGTPPDGAFNRVKLAIPRQESFVHGVAAAIGFDLGRGRIDRSAHPFCSGSHPGDVRITTRFADDDLIDALGSTMHEAGHAMYEQGLPAAHSGTPLGDAVSLGVHESQSRFWENHVGRSREFWQWCAPRVAAAFGDAVARFSAAGMYGAANLVRPDCIRVEADEATYNLHVVVRFDIELALVRGELPVAELPAAWNDAYRAALGVDVPDDARGCLQDVHWSCGLFGYFPTYTLGTLFAAQLFEAALAAMPELPAAMARGEFSPLLAWLREHVHRHGSRFPATELCVRATGAPLGTEPLMRHLEGKLRPLYGL